MLAEGLQRMAAQGKAIVFISHKLEEVLKLTTRLTVLRAGRVVFSAMTSDTNKAELAREMIGRDIATLRKEQQEHVLALAGAKEISLVGAPAESAAPGQRLLHVESLHVKDDRGLPMVRGVSFALHSGEILGIAGVDGNGQHELVEAIARLRPISAGRVLINERDASQWDTRDFIHNQAAYITDDRQNEGLILDFDLGHNGTLKIFQQPPFSQRGLLNIKEILRFTRQLITAFDIRAPGPTVRARTLSGGNQQKLVLARELSQSPRLIIANKPTRGLDIGAAAYIHQKLLDERAKGTAILLVSADLDEILMLSDRILVMYNGQSMGEVEAHGADIHTLGMMMAGTPLSELANREAGT
jgi:simple sugar transport system ATP-binding protein